MKMFYPSTQLLYFVAGVASASPPQILDSPKIKDRKSFTKATTSFMVVKL